MSYCVNCGVELDKTARACPLCRTPVHNPNAPVDTISPTPFPTERKEVPPVMRLQLALLLSTMILSAAICCGIVNLFLGGELSWSLYIIGAVIVLWVCLVLPLLIHNMPILLRVAFGVIACGLYVYLISLTLDGVHWFVGLALPIILTGGAIVILLGFLRMNVGRSILTSAIVGIGCAAVFVLLLELFIDRWNYGVWSPSWSLIALIGCVGLMIPLIVVRRVPSLRESMRRRFHT